jgi:hypothetical protein
VAIVQRFIYGGWPLYVCCGVFGESGMPEALKIGRLVCLI